VSVADQTLQILDRTLAVATLPKVGHLLPGVVVVEIRALLDQRLEKEEGPGHISLLAERDSESVPGAPVTGFPMEHFSEEFRSFDR
jgi:hypothetical protein